MTDITEGALRACPGGVHTFYLAPFDAVVAALSPGEQPDDLSLDVGAIIANSTGTPSLFVGVLFQDAVTIPPAAALRILGDALGTTNAPSADVTAGVSSSTHGQRRACKWSARRPSDGVRHIVHRRAATDR